MGTDLMESSGAGVDQATAIIVIASVILLWALPVTVVT